MGDNVASDNPEGSTAVLSQSEVPVIQAEAESTWKSLEIISYRMEETDQILVDALKCFQDNILEMHGFLQETEQKVKAFREMMVTVTSAVGLPTSNQ